MEALKRIIRTGQTYFPGLVDAKFAVRRKLERLLRRPFEADFQVLAAFKLRAGEQFIDVGGNRGQSVDAIRFNHPDAPILSFEPNPVLFDRLVSMFAADSDTRIFPYALGNQPGQFELFVPFYNGWMFDGLASMSETNARSDMGPHRLMAFDPDKVEIRKISCEVRRLDDLDLNPGLIKIDVEGCELMVLQGAAALIERQRPVFLTENNPGPEVANFLAERGYLRAAYRDGALHFGEKGIQNTFYFTQDRLNELDRSQIQLVGL